LLEAAKAVDFRYAQKAHYADRPLLPAGLTNLWANASLEQPRRSRRVNFRDDLATVVPLRWRKVFDLRVDILE
jgi:hypothetical protein